MFPGVQVYYCSIFQRVVMLKITQHVKKVSPMADNARHQGEKWGSPRQNDTREGSERPQNRAQRT